MFANKLRNIKFGPPCFGISTQEGPKDVVWGLSQLLIERQGAKLLAKELPLAPYFLFRHLNYLIALKTKQKHHLPPKVLRSTDGNQ